MVKVSGIYIILNTKNGMVYIGQTIDFRKRWNEHQSDLNRGCHGNVHLQLAWNKYGGKVFKFQKLEYCSVEQLDIREQHYLDTYLPKGNCYNVALDATAPNRGRKFGEETRRKISEALRKRPYPSEITRKKLSEVQKNRPPISEDTRSKMSASARNKPPVSDETRKKMSAVRIGKPKSEETRRRMSEGMKGKPKTAETRRKLSELRKGKKLSEEHRLKIGEGVKRRNALRKVPDSESKEQSENT